ncbi:putative uncharacterized protein DDB_G0267716 [Ceratitis capitata]|uniref:ETS-like protein pointed, isoform P2/D n=1 Tax=Ceratitis capitata TaxID=7213 RepID=W8C0S5_CERCA|nr:putative uncharacterized protein DDB_G0267716 [Ceratitis capitata]
MELAICKTELPTNRFMLPTAPASFYQKNNAHFSEILNFNTNYLFNNKINTNNNCDNNNSNNHINSASVSAINQIINNNQNISANNINNQNTNNSILNSCSSSNNNSSASSSSSMRLKKNRRVTFLKNLIETNIRIKEEPDDGTKDLPPPICSLSDMSDHEASIGE